ncbi:MAG: electron transport complex subunit RsxG [Rhodocyclaceae bacterium]|nr:electron transport complex subunit RsxG [Rhodocyclaceae bacterium]MBX3668900.1 electron transport complex subunit RsxG [Rhodocyclaceae bacterium]
MSEEQARPEEQEAHLEIAPEEDQPPGLIDTSVRSAALLFGFALVCTALMAWIYGATLPSITAAAEREKMKLIDEILPRALYDNNLLADTIELPSAPDLGQDEAIPVYRARKGGQPVALVFEAIAPEGYGGPIRLVIAVGADATVLGVRVVAHKETPGLGDYIDPRKDKNKKDPWIEQFSTRGATGLSEADWKVKKDGGRFDYMTGATISPRAVLQAVGRAARFAAAERERLYAVQPK